MTEMQKQFEEWAKNEGHIMDRALGPWVYDWVSTACAWRAWQASRAAVVVKLPLFCVDGVDAAEYRDGVIEALDDAGVSYEQY